MTVIGLEYVGVAAREREAGPRLRAEVPALQVIKV
jgi:hypothetical protein